MRTEPTCPICGSEVPPKRSTGPRATYCSRACRSKADYARRGKAAARSRTERRRALVENVCPECSAPFAPTWTLKQVYCSPACARRASRDSRSTTCSEAGCERPSRARRLCSMHLRRAYRAEGSEPNPAWSDRRRANWQKRRAQTRGAVDAEAFSYREIYERDGWTCGICALSVDPTLAWPDPMSASLDHVVPLSAGGAHTASNAQCAHLVCNLRKGARVA